MSRILQLGDLGQVILTLQNNGQIRIESPLDPLSLNMILDKVKQQLVANTQLGQRPQQGNGQQTT